MSTVREIEKALQALPIHQARCVADWLQDYLEEQWDRQIASDAEAGKLDQLADHAIEHYKAGRVKPLNDGIDNS